MQKEKTVLRNDQGKEILIGRDQIEYLELLDSRKYIDLSKDIKLSSKIEELISKLHELGFLNEENQKEKFYLVVDGFKFENISIKNNGVDYIICSMIENDKMKLFNDDVIKADTIQEFIDKHRTIITMDNLQESINFKAVEDLEVDVAVLEQKVEKQEKSSRIFFDLEENGLNVYDSSTQEIFEKIYSLGYMPNTGSPYQFTIKDHNGRLYNVDLNTPNGGASANILLSYGDYIYNGHTNSEDRIINIINVTNNQIATKGDILDNRVYIDCTDISVYSNFTLEQLFDRIRLVNNDSTDGSFYIRFSDFELINVRIEFKAHSGNQYFFTGYTIDDNGLASIYFYTADLQLDCIIFMQRLFGIQSLIGRIEALETASNQSE